MHVSGLLSSNSKFGILLETSRIINILLPYLSMYVCGYICVCMINSHTAFPISWSIPILLKFFPHASDFRIYAKKSWLLFFNLTESFCLLIVSTISVCIYVCVCVQVSSFFCLNGGVSGWHNKKNRWRSLWLWHPSGTIQSGGINITKIGVAWVQRNQRDHNPQMQIPHVQPYQ